MALGDYVATIWKNGTTPAINQSNLNHVENKVFELDAEAEKNDRERIMYVCMFSAL